MGLLLNVTTEDAPKKEKPPPAPPQTNAGKRKRLAPGPQDKSNNYMSLKPTQSDVKNNPGQLSSSLFTSNPAIPVIEPSSEKPTAEVLFEENSSFELLDVSKNIKGNIKTEFKCEAMTKVQKQSIPQILNKRDVQIQSPTGSGKTLAYSIPMVHFLQELQPPITRADGLYALVILPTRELVLQTFNVVSKLCRAHVRIVPGMLMGGEKKKSEKARLRKGVNILIGTPGRLADHLRSTCCLSFDRTQLLVLDEADKLVEMGFMKDVRYIVNRVREGSPVAHQTVLLSATISKGVEDLSELSLNDPVYIELGGDAEVEYNIPDQLKQHFIILPTKLRLVTLLSFISEKRTKKVIVFLSCKDSVEFHYEITSAVLSKYHEGEKFDLLKLHGSMEQSARVPVYNKFNTCESGILFTTDVAARGLDMPAIHWIVQYDCPGTVKDYVHRVGRTARAGKSGKSLLLLSAHESSYIDVLQKQKIDIKQEKYESCLEKLRSLVKTKRTEDAASQVQRVVEEYCKAKEAKGLAVRAFQSYVRAYRSSFFKEKFTDLHLGHVAKTFGLTESPSTFLHKNLSRKKQVEARKEHQFERKEKRHKGDGFKKKTKRKLNLVSDRDMAGLAVLSGPQPKKSKS